MADEHSFRDLVHRVMHRIPGVPVHAEHPAGHHGRAGRNSVAHHRSHSDGWNHSPARPPRVLVAWQHRIAAFFGQEPR
jgi:hypothetical protein